MGYRMLSVAVVGLLAIAGVARGQVVVVPPGPDLILTTDGALLVTVANNEAAIDSQLAAKAIEIRGIAKKITRTETGYVLQFSPNNLSDNFVRLYIDCEFPADQRDALGNISLPAGVTIRGAVKESKWTPRYDNHRHYTVTIRDSQLTAVYPLLR